MKKYIILYYAPMDAMQQMSQATPEEQQKGMEAWMSWSQSCGDHLVELGAPLMNGLKLRTDGTSENSDKEVTGYSIMQAENIEGVKKMLDKHPHLTWNANCSIEIHETMPLPDM
jgi:hypothetical protein